MHTVNIRFRAALLILASCCVLSAKATSYNWVPAAGDIEYETETNWDPNGEPGDADTIVAQSGTSTLRLNANHTVYGISGKTTSHQMTVDLNGYDLTLSGGELGRAIRFSWNVFARALEV